MFVNASTSPRLAAPGPAVAGLVDGPAIAISPPQAAAATTICEKYGSTTIEGGRYVVQNNERGRRCFHLPGA
ncbi:hypothetical protein [Saccharothrix sp. ALI-22-I]|uniref:hypothetical protein n=1 Tax=Saccharothrix sp. ALI-22-I TaxID=1933778 RepID=UPI001930F0E0|nr:hypothetical protein [Saccharothrix sp. ALI-22-I]